MLERSIPKVANRECSTAVATTQVVNGIRREGYGPAAVVSFSRARLTAPFSGQQLHDTRWRTLPTEFKETP